MNGPPVEVERDPRFLAGIEAFNSGEYFEAAEAFEEVFFEAVRDEVEFVRVFLQISTGVHHVERGQLRAAIERLEEGIAAIGRVSRDRGFHLERLADAVRVAIQRIGARMRGDPAPIVWPTIERS